PSVALCARLRRASAFCASVSFEGRPLTTNVAVRKSRRITKSLIHFKGNFLAPSVQKCVRAKPREDAIATRIVRAILAVIGLALIVGQMWTPSALAGTVTMFNLKGVTFQDGGSAIGSFVIDLVDYSSPQLISVNITTTQGTEFSGTTYQVLD